jgi:hypothetical protein
MSSKSLLDEKYSKIVEQRDQSILLNRLTFKNFTKELSNESEPREEDAGYEDLEHCTGGCKCHPHLLEKGILKLLMLKSI